MTDNNDDPINNNDDCQPESDPIAEGKSVLIKNLKFETSPSRVRKIFEKYGPVRDVYIPLDYFTRRPRGFAFVEFFSADDASIAVKSVHKTLVDGNEVTVLLAQDRRKTPDTMRSLCSERGRNRGYDNYNSRNDHRYSNQRDRYGNRDRGERYCEGHREDRYRRRYDDYDRRDRRGGGGRSRSRSKDRHFEESRRRSRSPDRLNDSSSRRD